MKKQIVFLNFRNIFFSHIPIKSYSYQVKVARKDITNLWLEINVYYKY